MMTDVEDFLQYLAAVRNASPRTVNNYAAVLQQVEEYFHTLDENLNWRTLESDVVRMWVAEEMERGISPRTIATALSALRTFYRYLLMNSRVERDPIRKIRNPKGEKRLPTFLRDAEVDDLFDRISFPNTYEGQRDRLILLTFYHTGIRRSELQGLDLGDVRLSEHELRVMGKRRKERIVPFGNELAEALKLYLPLRAERAAEGEKALFLGSKGTRIASWKIGDVVHAYLSLVTSARQRSPHVLRHTYATSLLSHGAGLESIKELLGHESVATTEIYTHTTFADLQKEYMKAHPRNQ